MTDTNGVKEERPVFFSGFGHFESAAEDVPFFQDIGANVVQIGLNFRDVYAAFVQDYISGFIAETHGDCDATIEGTTEEAASGKHSLKIVNRSKKASGISANIQQRIEVEPNTTYVFGFKAKGKNVNYTYFLQEWDFNNTQRFIQSSDDWQEYSVEFTTPKLMGDKETFIQIISEDIVDELYIDDIYVVKKGTTENILYEGGFETSLRELTPVEKEVKEHGFAVNYFGINKLRRYLEAAEQNNILVDICLCYHYFEDSRMVKTDPDAYAYYGRYMPFDPQNETVRTLHKLWTKVMGEVLNDYDSVNSICILNEPQFLPYTSEAYIPKWQEYLVNKYGTIDELNKVYGSSYKSFSEIEMPKNPEHTARFYDYRNFNEDIMTEFQEFLAKEVKAAYPDKLIHSKIMGFLRHDYYNFLSVGVDPERLGDLYEINGCDISVHYKNSLCPMTTGMAWIDYMTSISDKPVWDTEAHPLTDRVFVEFRDELEPVYVAASVWNGAVHGRQASMMWLWETSYNLSMWNKNTWANANFRHRPNLTAMFAKVNLDLMRLSKEITAIQKHKADVGIIMSRNSLGYGDNHMKNFVAAYEDAVFSGQKVGVVTDLQPENMHKYKLLVIPGATHVKPDMLENIKTFIQNGGKIVILGTDSLVYDEYNKPHNSETVEYIYNHANTDNTAKEVISSMGLSDVVLIDVETGKIPEKIEWSYGEYEGKIVVNVLNHDYEQNRTLKVMYKGKEIATMTDLRSMEQFSNTVTATPYEALLLLFEK